MEVTEVKDLVSEGKAYDLSYNGKKVCNVSLEGDTVMTKRLAFEIIMNAFKQYGISTDKATGTSGITRLS